MMKFALFILFSLLIISSPNHARKDPEDYWKSVMKDQPMPDAIKGLLHQESPSPSDHIHSTSKAGNVKPFNRNFDTTPIAIIYHKHVQPKDEKHPNTVHEAGTKNATYAAKKAEDSHN